MHVLEEGDGLEVKEEGGRVELLELLDTAVARGLAEARARKAAVARKGEKIMVLSASIGSLLL